MCGISDYPFRAICRQMGAELTFTQMVSSEGLTRSNTRSLKVLDLEPGEPMLAMQLFGGEPDALAESARILEERGAIVLDFNMGCPASKITSGHSGAALLKDLPRVGRIYKALRAATRLPLTVKMRWDWTEGKGVAIEAAQMAEGEGLDGVCLHARTRSQGYSGQANWEQIALLKQAVSIPVVGNGDVREPADALEMMRLSGCDAVMIGRALIGDPWLIAETLEAIRRGEAPEFRQAPEWTVRRRMIIDHARLMAERYGPKGLVLFRKHAAAYLRSLRGAKIVRERIMHVSTIEQLEDALGQEVPTG